MTRRGAGLVIGKFLPLHNGHVHLIRVAAALSERLHIVVCSLPEESIPGELRVAWVKELFPSATVHHLSEPLPSAPEEHAEFWNLWRDALNLTVPESVDTVFASEDYGERLAHELNATFTPVDIERSAVPISGTRIRKAPLRHWRYLPEPVRAHYALRVCVFGPESVGKTTLAKKLAAEFDTVWVPEFARGYLEQRNGDLVEDDLVPIAQGQKAAEESLARQANRLLFMDTDPLSTTLWAKKMFGRCDAQIEELAAERPADLFLLCDVDVPWVKDEVRYLPEGRREFFDDFERTLQERGLNYRVVRGSWDERWEAARGAVEKLKASQS